MARNCKISRLENLFLAMHIELNPGRHARFAPFVCEDNPTIRNPLSAHIQLTHDGAAYDNVSITSICRRNATVARSAALCRYCCKTRRGGVWRKNRIRSATAAIRCCAAALRGESNVARYSPQNPFATISARSGLAPPKIVDGRFSISASHTIMDGSSLVPQRVRECQLIHPSRGRILW